MQTVNLYKLALLISKDIEDIGLRPGEKLYEVLINKEELPYTYIEDDYIMIKSNRNTEKNILDKPYSSDTADEMSEKDMIDMVSETNHSLKKSLIEKAIY
jgi:FlaA1/EpsC-like NDP-sugar epimerase